MAEVSIDLNMVRVSNEEFLKKAADCAPQLKETLVRPVEIVDIRETDGVYPVSYTHLTLPTNREV